MRGPEKERREEKKWKEKKRRDEGWQSQCERERRGGSELHLSWPSKRLYKEEENGRRLWRLQAVYVIYETLWGIDDWPAKGGKNNTAPYSIYRLWTQRDSPCRELSDEVVADVQNFQFLYFTQPFWHRLHMVPTGRQGNVRHVTWNIIHWKVACIWIPCCAAPEKTRKQLKFLISTADLIKRSNSLPRPNWKKYSKLITSALLNYCIVVYWSSSPLLCGNGVQ